MPSLTDLANSTIFETLASGDVAEIDTIIEEEGVSGILKKGVPCPCARVETYQGAVGCPVCAGLGKCYPAPLRMPVMALVSSRRQQAQQTTHGLHLGGDARATFPSSIGVPAIGDQFWPDCERHTVTQLIVHRRQPFDGAKLRYNTTYPAAQRIPVLKPEEDRLIYPDVTEVEWLGIRGDDGQVVSYKEGQDYKISKSRDGERAVICWMPGRAPAPGSMISIRYAAPAVYQIHTVAPAARFSTGGALLPYMATLTALYRLSKRGDLR